MKYFDSNNLRIYNEDFLDLEIKEKANLIITSPPYNINLQYNSYDDSREYKDYLKFISKCFKKAYEISAVDARLCVDIPIYTIFGNEHRYNSGDIYKIAIENNWNYRYSIIWNSNHVSKRTAWGSWMQASAPNLISPCEEILVFYKNLWKRLEGGKSDIERKEFMDYTWAYWSFPGAMKKLAGGHPAPFPVEIPRRCIKLFSFVDDIILDPFLGSGSTLIACLELQRKGIGVEIDKKYCNIAANRIKNNRLFNQRRINNY